MGRKKGKMAFRDAMDLVPDDLPDGAYWAMAHEIAGLEYGEGFDQIAPSTMSERDSSHEIKSIRKAIKGAEVVVYNHGHHLKINGRTDYWPKRQKWYDNRTSTKGRGFEEMIEFLLARPEQKDIPNG